MDGIRGRTFVITGGFSLVGSHIAEQLLAAGAGRVRLLDNGAVGQASTVRELLADPRVEAVPADVLRLDALLNAFQQADGVFHAAFFITMPLANDLWTGMDVNVRGTMNVLEACRWQRVPRLVYSSSIAAYGHPQSPEVSEDDPFDARGMKPAAALYGAAKIMGEQLCALYQERHGLAYACLRYATVYGERQHRRGMHVMAMMAAYEAARAGRRPVIEGTGTDRHDYVYAGDVGRANLLAMCSEHAAAAYTIATGSTASVGEVVRLVLGACGCEAEPEYVSSASGNPNVHHSVPRFSVDKARRELGWEPQVPLPEGVRRLVAWQDAHQSAQVSGKTPKAGDS
jgi:UDP-glucose 4-epimerase